MRTHNTPVIVCACLQYEGVGNRWFDAAAAVFGGPLTSSYDPKLGAGTPLEAVETAALTLLADPAIAEMVPLGGIHVATCISAVFCGRLHLWGPPLQIPLDPTGANSVTNIVYALAGPPTGEGVTAQLSSITVSGSATLDMSGTGALTPALRALLANPFDGNRSTLLAAAVGGGAASVSMCNFTVSGADSASPFSFAKALRAASALLAPAPRAAWLQACLQGTGSVHGASQGAGVLFAGIQVVIEASATFAPPPLSCLDGGGFVWYGTVRTALPSVSCNGTTPASTAALGMTWFSPPVSLQPLGPSIILGPVTSYSVIPTAVVQPGLPPLRAVSNCSCPLIPSAGNGTLRPMWVEPSFYAGNFQAGTRVFSEVIAINETSVGSAQGSGFDMRPSVGFGTMYDAYSSFALGAGRGMSLADTVIKIGAHFKLWGAMATSGSLSLDVPGTVLIASSGTITRLGPAGARTLTPNPRCRQSTDVTKRFIGSSHAGCDSETSALYKVLAAGKRPSDAFLACWETTYGSATVPILTGCDAPMSASGGIAIVIVNDYGPMYLDGVLDASATHVPSLGLNVSSGGASGGSIYIQTPVMASAGGSLSARGGNGGIAVGQTPLKHGAGGSGGRIAVYCNTLLGNSDLYPSGSLAVSVAGGQDGSGGTTWQGAAGTLYIKCARASSAYNDMLMVQAGCTGASRPAHIGTTIVGKDLPDTLESIYLQNCASIAFVHNATIAVDVTVRRLATAQFITLTEPTVTVVDARSYTANLVTYTAGRFSLAIGAAQMATIDVGSGQRVSVGIRPDGTVYRVPMATTIEQAHNTLDFSGQQGTGYLASLYETAILARDGSNVIFPHAVMFGTADSVVNATALAKVRLPALGGDGVYLHTGGTVMQNSALALPRFTGALAAYLGCSTPAQDNSFPLPVTNLLCLNLGITYWTQMRNTVAIAQPWTCWANAPVATYDRTLFYWVNAPCTSIAARTLTLTSKLRCNTANIGFVPAGMVYEAPAPEVDTIRQDLIVCGTFSVPDTLSTRSATQLYVGPTGIITVRARSGVAATGGGAHAGCTAFQPFCSTFEGGDARAPTAYGSTKSPWQPGSAGSPAIYAAGSRECNPGGVINLVLTGNATVLGVIDAAGDVSVARSPSHSPSCRYFCDVVSRIHMSVATAHCVHRAGPTSQHCQPIPVRHRMQRRLRSHRSRRVLHVCRNGSHLSPRVGGGQRRPHLAHVRQHGPSGAASLLVATVSGWNGAVVRSQRDDLQHLGRGHQCSSRVPHGKHHLRSRSPFRRRSCRHGLRGLFHAQQHRRRRGPCAIFQGRRFRGCQQRVADVEWPCAARRPSAGVSLLP